MTHRREKGKKECIQLIDTNSSHAIIHLKYNIKGTFVKKQIFAIAIFLVCVAAATTVTYRFVNEEWVGIRDIGTL